jgi:DNA recombination protein RmuC
MVDFMEIIFLGIGLLIGTITAWFIAKYKFTNRNGSLNRNEINEKYVLKEIHSSIQNQADLLRDNLEEKEQELRKIGSQLSAKENEIVNINERLVSQKSEVENLQQRFQTEFENIANRLLEEKSQSYFKSIKTKNSRI